MSSPFNGTPINLENKHEVFRSVQVDNKTPSTATHHQPLDDDLVRGIVGGYEQHQLFDNQPSYGGWGHGTSVAPSQPLKSLGDMLPPSLSSSNNMSSGGGFDQYLESSGWNYNSFQQQQHGVKDLTLVAVTSAPHSEMDSCPPVPVWVEQYSTFIVDRRNVLEDIDAHLTTIGIDHTLLEHKIRGLVYPADRAGACEFRVYRYRCESAGHWMIEVQRRSGCIFAFNHLYRSIVAATSSYQITFAISDSSSKSLDISSLGSSLPPLSSLAPLPSSLPNPALAEPSGDLLGAPSTATTVEPLTVKQLASMASSPAIEVAREGIESLAVLSSMSPSHASAVCVAAKALLPLSIYTVAATMVATARPPTARAAAELLANICCASKEGVTFSLACDSLVPSLLAMLDAPSSLSLKAVKRESARCIAAISSSDIGGCRKAFAIYDALPTSAFTGIAILERYSAVDDVSIRSSVTSALTNMRNNTVPSSSTSSTPSSSSPSSSPVIVRV